MKPRVSDLAFALLVLATLLLSPALSWASDKRPSLPTSVLSARTIYVDNQTASAELQNTAYTELAKWGRFQVVDAPQKAEIVLALAWAGGSDRAQALADDLDKLFSENTIVQFNYLPTLHAQLALRRYETSKAIEVLRAAAPYELGNVGFGKLYPVFVRGEVYRAAGKGREAATEFQRILDHRSFVLNEPIGALARLGLARAYVLQGDTAKARAAYQDFLALWKDADPDIPILKQAKAEYAKLQ
jgi:ATP/maltotriose-dependent transcriptional regulator MalT